MLTQQNIISIHLDWIRKGYAFNDILSIYDELENKDGHPFNVVELKDIQNYIGGNIALSERLNDSTLKNSPSSFIKIMNLMAILIF